MQYYYSLHPKLVNSTLSSVSIITEITNLRLSYSFLFGMFYVAEGLCEYLNPIIKQFWYGIRKGKEEFVSHGK
jgi:hypothetical protein